MTPSDQRQGGRVRELCRNLKPIIGAQADRAWLAYVAENEEGKDQIQDYLELLAAQQFQGTLETEGPGPVPPGPGAAAGEYALGSVAYNGRELYPFGLRENEWTQHVGVFGRSGAGKTNLGFLIVQELVRKGKPVLILDWKRNYRDLLSIPGPGADFVNAAVYTIGRAVSPLTFNPLIPPPQTNPQTWLKKLIAVIAQAYLLGDGVIYLLQEAIDRVFTEAGVYSGSVNHWPTFRDVLEALKQRQNSGREAGWMSSALRALSSLCFGEMDTLLNQTSGTIDVRELLTRPVILELDALTQSDKVFFAQAIILYIHHLRMAEPVREQLKNAIVIEEAHHLLSNERQSLVGGQSVMDIAYREIREYGVSFISLDQHPSQISMPALGNTYCTVCFNLKHKTDVSAMNMAMLLPDDQKNLLGDLQVGQAVVRLQGRSVKPFMLAVPEFHIQKGSFTDADVITHMTKLGLLSARGHPAQHGEFHPHRNDKPATIIPSGTPDVTTSLLLDVHRFPESGVAQRYRRRD